MLAVGLIRQRERAGEAAIRSFVAVEGIALVLLLRLPLARDRQPIASHVHLEVLLLDPGNVSLEDEGILVLPDLERGRVARDVDGRHRRHLAEGIPAQHVAHEPKRIPLAARNGAGLSRILFLNSNVGHDHPPYWGVDCGPIAGPYPQT